MKVDFDLQDIRDSRCQVARGWAPWVFLVVITSVIYQIPQDAPAIVEQGVLLAFLTAWGTFFGYAFVELLYLVATGKPGIVGAVNTLRSDTQRWVRSEARCFRSAYCVRGAATYVYRLRKQYEWTERTAYAVPKSEKMAQVLNDLLQIIERKIDLVASAIAVNGDSETPREHSAIQPHVKWGDLVALEGMILPLQRVLNRLLDDETSEWDRKRKYPAIALWRFKRLRHRANRLFRPRPARRMALLAK